MKIILVATDNHGKNLVFVSHELRAYSLSEAVKLTEDGRVDNVYTVRRGTGIYLRTKQSLPKQDQLDALAVSSHRLFTSLDDGNYAGTTPALGEYLRLYQGTVVRDEPYIRIARRPWVQILLIWYLHVRPTILPMAICGVDNKVVPRVG